MFLKNTKPPIPDGDRAELNSTARRKTSPGQRLFGVTIGFAAVAIILGGLVYQYWWIPGHKTTSDGATQTAVSSGGIVPPQLTAALNLATPAGAPAPLPPGLSAPSQPPSSQGQVTTVTPAAQPAAAQTPAQVNDQALKDEQATEKRQLGSDMGAMPSGSPPAAATTASRAPTPLSTSTVSSNGAGSNALAAQLHSTETPKSLAGYIQNPSLTVIKGSVITCVLDTDINSDTPGFTSCVTDKPVMSMDGQVVLLEAGTTIDGEAVAKAQPGEKKYPVLFGRAVTPNAVTIELTSPGTDPLGAAGLDGAIDHHYCEKYCGAFLYSIIEDATTYGTQAATSSTGSTGTTVVLPQNTIQNGQTTANQLLTDGKDIKPTFSKNHGDTIAITVARDLDFSNIYQLDARQ